MSSRFYYVLVGTGLVFGLSLALALLDGAGWLVLPQVFRPAIPVGLVLSAFLGIVLLSGAIGTPKRPGAESEDAAPPESGAAPKEEPRAV